MRAELEKPHAMRTVAGAGFRAGWMAAALSLLLPTLALASGDEPVAVEREYASTPPAPVTQTWAEADAKSAGCVSCHTASDQKTMHASEAVVLGCTDCHGGNATVMAPAGASATPLAEAHGEEGKEEGEGHGGRKYESGYQAAMESAHVLPRYPDVWPSSANPVRSYTALNKEPVEFVRFVNPGDYRVAREACGNCHLPVIQAAERSLMANAAMFWGAATSLNPR